MFDPSALSIVLAGTAVATLARAGWSNCLHALRSAIRLTGKGFDASANRTAFARMARAIQKRGVLGAEEPLPPDPALAKAVAELVRTGSVNAMEDSLARHGANDAHDNGRAAIVFEQAGELAPVFGLVGTLFAMTQIAPGADADATVATFGAIATAVLSSLYGVLSAHLIFLPVAGAITRRARDEEAARLALIEWLSHEIAAFVPSSKTTLKPAA
ncbi:MAG: MotA/TolQ/ExbB proton channel family protein [Erythrobacter sp.]